MTLAERYEAERAKLLLCAKNDQPAGEYAAPVFGVGLLPSEVMFIGEAPGAEETRRCAPFVGKAGRQLNVLIAQARINRDSVYITNVVKYRPVVRSARSTRNRTPGPKEIAAALPLLREEILAVAPNVVVTLGNVPLKAILQLCGAESMTIGVLHGRPVPLKLGDAELTLFPLYHPASGIYNRSLVPVMEADVLALGEHLVKRAQTLDF